MLAQLDDVVFETNSNIAELLEKFTFNFSKIDRIGNNPTYQKVNGYEHEITFSGYFILKKLSELDDLKQVGMDKKPIYFISKDSHFLVIIETLTINKSLFLKSGEYIKQGFEITLKRYFK